MQLHDLKPIHPRKTKKIVGRGGKRGKTAGRGTKGQNARAGRKKVPELRTIIKKLPKLRGYRFGTISPKAVAINVSTIGALFAKGEEVSPKTLLAKKLINKKQLTRQGVKILGTGEIAIPVTVSGCLVSTSAKEKIEKAGGSVVAK